MTVEAITRIAPGVPAIPLSGEKKLAMETATPTMPPEQSSDAPILAAFTETTAIGSPKTMRGGQVNAIVQQTRPEGNS